MYTGKSPAVLAAFVFFFTGTLMAGEEPKYTVESKTDVYEVRRYAPMLVAETTVQAEFDDAGNEAFRILAGFIFGKNRSQEKIAMTAPVKSQPNAQADRSEKIAMTAPVTSESTADGFTYQFMMPSKYTRETLPVPEDDRVEIKEIPERTFAVLRYSGTWSQARYNEHRDKLLAALQQDGVRVTGEPIWSRYDAPFKPWFLRRNEIWVPVATGNRS
jgi:hypothetical protein